MGPYFLLPISISISDHRVSSENSRGVKYGGEGLIMGGESGGSGQAVFWSWVSVLCCVSYETGLTILLSGRIHLDMSSRSFLPVIRGIVSPLP